MNGPVVVTGASGFIGRAVSKELRDRGVETLAYSRRIERDSVQVADYREISVPDGAVLLHLAEESRVDLVDADVAGAAESLLAALLSLGFGHVVYASSAVLYGDGSAVPHGPGDPVRTDTPYQTGKRNCETRIAAAGGMVLRLTNVYGPGMRDGTVFSDVVAQLGLTEPVTVRDAAPVRDFLWVGDAARGLADAALSEASGTYNLGTGIGTSVGELAGRICALAGEPGRPVRAQRPGGKPSCLVVDISETTGATGWRPEVSLERGLATMMAAR